MSAVVALWRQARSWCTGQDDRHGHGGARRQDRDASHSRCADEDLRDVVLENVEPGSVVSTDELMSYGLLAGDGFIHGAVKHAAKEWSYYDYRTGETFSTNTIEGFWKLFKASVRSIHIHISGEKMPLYLAEFAFRSNHRQFGNGMV
jgi:hypothetical protein